MTFARTLILAAVLVFPPAAACNGGDDDGAAAADPPFPVTGMLTDVAASDGNLEGITLRDDDGIEWTFAVLLDAPGSVTADHLEEHIRLSQPVLVYFRGSGDNRTAYHIDDAPPP
jgi:hypothetical protein